MADLHITNTVFLKHIDNYKSNEIFYLWNDGFE